MIAAVIGWWLRLLATWRAQSARSWPRHGDTWHGWSVGYLVVVRLARRDGEAGVMVRQESPQRNVDAYWVSMSDFAAVTSTLTLVERT